MPQINKNANTNNTTNNNILFKIGKSCCLLACLTGHCGRGSAAVESISVRRHWIVYCSVHGIASPVAQVGSVCVGKGKGYNCMRAENAMPSQNLVIITFIMCHTNRCCSAGNDSPHQLLTKCLFSAMLHTICCHYCSFNDATIISSLSVFNSLSTDSLVCCFLHDIPIKSDTTQYSLINGTQQINYK